MRIALGPFCSYHDCCDEGLEAFTLPGNEDAIFCSQEHLDAALDEGPTSLELKEAVRFPG